MWLKQLSIYRLPEIPEEHHLNESLGNSWFAPCQGLDWFTEGFVYPVDPNLVDTPVVEAAGTLRICLKREEKVLPSGVINDALAEKVRAIQNKEARNIGRKEKQELKDNIIDDLLPRAFTRSSLTRAILTEGLLLIDNANHNKAEALLVKLREALRGLEARPPVTRQSPSSLMTEWLLKGEAQGRFELDFDVTFKGNGDVAPTVKISKKDLTGQDVVQHAENGMNVVELGLVWDGKIAFVLTQDLRLKRIQWLDILQEEAENSADDTFSLTTATQIIISRTITEMLEELIGYLGGWQN